MNSKKKYRERERERDTHFGEIKSTEKDREYINKYVVFVRLRTQCQSRTVISCKGSKAKVSILVPSSSYLGRGGKGIL